MDVAQGEVQRDDADRDAGGEAKTLENGNRPLNKET
jgi:hypothetical protein